MKKKIIFIALILVAVVAAAWVFNVSTQPIDFTTQVKPIINKNCITCHGGVRQKGGFSLLFREEALAKQNPANMPLFPAILVIVK